jgi:hypothetical protein
MAAVGRGTEHGGLVCTAETRLTMNRLLAALRCTQPSVHAALSRPQSIDGDAGSPVSDQPEPPGACGWFDSSHALQHGLCVTEHASADAVATDLPLADWLQLHLSGWVTLSGAEALHSHGAAPH